MKSARPLAQMFAIAAAFLTLAFTSASAETVNCVHLTKGCRGGGEEEWFIMTKPISHMTRILHRACGKRTFTDSGWMVPDIGDLDLSGTVSYNPAGDMLLPTTPGHGGRLDAGDGDERGFTGDGSSTLIIPFALADYTFQ